MALEPGTGMTTENVNVTINGLTLAVPNGTTIIEAAKQAGVLIPHYCYHPSLPSPAVCRMFRHHRSVDLGNVNLLRG